MVQQERANGSAGKGQYIYGQLPLAGDLNPY